MCLDHLCGEKVNVIYSNKFSRLENSQNVNQKLFFLPKKFVARLCKSSTVPATSKSFAWGKIEGVENKLVHKNSSLERITSSSSHLCTGTPEFKPTEKVCEKMTDIHSYVKECVI